LVFRKNARAKSGLNKAILDQGWFAFLQMLDYKPRQPGDRPGLFAA